MLHLLPVQKNGQEENKHQKKPLNLKWTLRRPRKRSGEQEDREHRTTCEMVRGLHGVRRQRGFWYHTNTLQLSGATPGAGQRQGTLVSPCPSAWVSPCHHLCNPSPILCPPSQCPPYARQVESSSWGSLLQGQCLSSNTFGLFIQPTRSSFSPPCAPRPPLVLSSQLALWDGWLYMNRQAQPQRPLCVFT